MKSFNFIETARKAWERAPEGRSEIGGHRVARDNKMILVTNRKRMETNIVAFPRPEHSEAFEKAIGALHAGGPATTNPGDVGTVRLLRYNQAVLSRNPILHDFLPAIRKEVPEARPSFYQLVFAQSHFTTTGEKARRGGESVDKEALLPRSLATKYGGWMFRALKEAITLAGEENRDVLLSKQEEHTRRLFAGNKGAAFRAELEKACRETGARIMEGKHFLIVRPAVP